MEKFTKVKDKKEPIKKNRILFDAKSFKVKTGNLGWNFIDEADSVCVIPILIYDNEVLLRMEVVPSYQDKDSQDYHLTCISGTIEGDESPKECIIRELEEEAGLKLKEGIDIEIYDALYKSKTGNSKFHLCILPLNLYDYTEVNAMGDGSKTEELSKTVRVKNSNLNRLFPSDIVTKLLLEEAKKYLNL
jgi:8-oxo-dGTP pyrophosphatase MutT (NUDIX family)